MEAGNKLFLSPKIKDFIEGEALTNGLSITNAYLLDDLTNIRWLRYDYSTMNKTWDKVDLTPYIH